MLYIYTFTVHILLFYYSTILLLYIYYFISTTYSVCLLSLYTIYTTERRPIALANTELSLYNYNLTANLARTLGVDPNLATIAVEASNNTITNNSS